MAYQRQTVSDGLTVMNKYLYDNVQDGIDEAREGLASAAKELKSLGTAMQTKMEMQTDPTGSMRAYVYTGETQGNCPISAVPMPGALITWPDSGNLQTGEPQDPMDCVRRRDLDRHANGPCYVRRISDGEVELFMRGYDGQYDLAVVLAQKGINRLMSIDGWYKIPTTPDGLANRMDASRVTLLDGGNINWISSHVVYATTSINGKFPGFDTALHTGGEYGYADATAYCTATARTAWVKVLADGRELCENGEGAYASEIRVIWRNLLQGSNTQKSNGSGREIVSETVTLTCSGGGEVRLECELCPLEPVLYREYCGMRMYNGLDGSVSFVGSTGERRGRGVDVPGDSRDTYCRMVRLTGPQDVFEMELDNGVGLGTQCLNENVFSARVRQDRISEMSLVAKGTPHPLGTGEKLVWRGAYRAYPRTTPTVVVNYELQDVTCSNVQAEVGEYDPYCTRLKVERGFALDADRVQVSMGGADVTATVYGGDLVEIPCTSGDVTVRATSVRLYTNQIPLSTDASGNRLNEMGYLPDIKLSMYTGEEMPSTKGVATTGFIPIPAGAVLRFDGMESSGMQQGLVFYDADKAHICGTIFPMMLGDALLAGGCLVDADDNVYSVDLTALTEHYEALGRPVAYVRGTFGSVSDRSVLTVNEEITD